MSIRHNGPHGPPVVTAVSRRAEHHVSKLNQDSIRLLAGIGVEDDAHGGMLVQHRSRLGRDPAPPNLRQVHLIHSELHEELGRRGFRVGAGEMGENVTTRGIELLSLPTGTRLTLGGGAVVDQELQALEIAGPDDRGRGGRLAVDHRQYIPSHDVAFDYALPRRGL